MQAAPAGTPSFDLLSPEFLRDPYPLYHQLRAMGGLFQSPAGFWLATRHETVNFVLRDKRFGKRFRENMTRLYAADVLREPVFHSLGNTMLVLDPPDHTRLRGLVAKAFTALRVEEMRPRIQHIVDTLLSGIERRRRMDVIADFAHKLPVIVICDMLGIPESDRGQFLDGSRVNGRVLDPVPMTRAEIDAANARHAETADYFQSLFDRRRKDPKNDLLTALVQAEDEGGKLTADELNANTVLLFAAGHETTANLIGNGLLALHRDPSQWSLLKARPEIMPDAVEELLRYDSSVQLTARTAHADIVVDGHAIAAGETVLTLLGAANRDPAVYPDPDKLDVTRTGVRAISFGGGLHYCLGAQLARIEGEIAFRSLLARLPDLRLDELDAPAWRPTFALRGLERLPASW